MLFVAYSLSFVFISNVCSSRLEPHQEVVDQEKQQVYEEGKLLQKSIQEDPSTESELDSNFTQASVIDPPKKCRPGEIYDKVLGCVEPFHSTG